MQQPRYFALGTRELPAVLRIPDKPVGLIIFAHGSGSGHRSPRNNQVAEALGEVGFATLLFDLLTVDEEQNRRNVFDIELLAGRLVEAVEDARNMPELKELPIGLFGASTGAGAALLAASQRPDLVEAVVSRGGRPDLAGAKALKELRTPTMLIVGGVDYHVIKLNDEAAALMHCPHEIVIVPGAGHLFEEPGTLSQVIDHAARWFRIHLANLVDRTGVTPVPLPFENRTMAGRLLSARLKHLRTNQPLVLALPRGGVPVGYEIARVLDAELDLMMVRKLGAPGNPEFAIGAVVDGAEPQVVFNEDAMEAISPSREYVRQELNRQLVELERRRHAYMGLRRKPCLDGRTVIVVDDGIATGSTITAALRGARRNHPDRLVLAAPVAPPSVVDKLAGLCDEIVVLAKPAQFNSVGQYYRDFRQIEDSEVIALLKAADRDRPHS